jgi:hypothetical protein
MPEVVLGRRPSVWADLFGHDPSLRLYRRGIEVRDVLLATHQIPALDRGVAAPRDSEISRDLEALLELARTWPSIPGNPATEAAA